LVELAPRGGGSCSSSVADEPDMEDALPLPWTLVGEVSVARLPLDVPARVVVGGFNSCGGTGSSGGSRSYDGSGGYGPQTLSPRERVCRVSSCCRHGRTRRSLTLATAVTGARGASAAAAGAHAGSSCLLLFWDFLCCNCCIPVLQQILGVLQSFAFMLQSFLVYVANRCAHVASVFLTCCECPMQMFQS
jgi:hypothetical protein